MQPGAGGAGQHLRADRCARVGRLLGLPAPSPDDGLFDVDEVSGTEAAVTGSTAELAIDWYGYDQAAVAGRNLLFWLGNTSEARLVNGMLEQSRSRGYYRWVIPDEADPIPFQLRLNPDANGADYQLNFAIDESTGYSLTPRIGSIGRSSLHVIEVGSGDIQMNLNWNTLVDLDLWVTDPTGFRIYYGDETAPSGGSLDLDSYPACAFEGDRGRGNENVFWPVGHAPAGSYVVEVDMYDDCGTYASNVPTLYRVTIVQHDVVQVITEASTRTWKRPICSTPSSARTRSAPSSSDPDYGAISSRIAPSSVRSSSALLAKCADGSPPASAIALSRSIVPLVVQHGVPDDMHTRHRTRARRRLAAAQRMRCILGLRIRARHLGGIVADVSWVEVTPLPQQRCASADRLPAHSRSRRRDSPHRDSRP